MPRFTRRSLLGGGALLAATATLGRRARASTAASGLGSSTATGGLGSVTAAGDVLAVPGRPVGALGGQDVALALSDLPDHDRYVAFAQQILDGNKLCDQCGFS